MNEPHTFTTTLPSAGRVPGFRETMKFAKILLLAGVLTTWAFAAEASPPTTPAPPASENTPNATSFTLEASLPVENGAAQTAAKPDFSSAKDDPQPALQDDISSDLEEEGKVSDSVTNSATNSVPNGATEASTAADPVVDDAAETPPETVTPGVAPGEAEASTAEILETEATPQKGAAPVLTEAEHIFPIYPIVERQKRFWLQIFTRYDVREGLLHDGLVGLPVYEAVDLRDKSRRAGQRYVAQRKQAIRKRIQNLARAMEKGVRLSAAQRDLLALFPQGTKPKTLRTYARKVRFQRGLRNRFRKGLERSGRVLAELRSAMARHGVPEDLAYLPHVESSFYAHTYSQAGAAGIWQFMRSTGKLFMRVDSLIDERLDPLLAGDSAARYLRRNYERLGNWPLAITAYNHGPVGLDRIAKRMGTRNLGLMIEGYNGRNFGVASKNFYAEFLAAREVALHPERYFDSLTPQPPMRYHEVKLPFYLETQTAVQAAGIPIAQLRKLNPALKSLIWSATRRIPPGYRMRLPVQTSPERFLDQIPAQARHTKQKQVWAVRVQRGDTLYGIALRNRISWRALARANGITSARKLRPGQKLIIPRPRVPASKRTASQTLNPPRVAKTKSLLVSAAQKAPASSQTRPETQPPRKLLPQSTPVAQPSVQKKAPLRAEILISANYEESLEHYAKWGGTSTSALRQRNKLSRRKQLVSGQSYHVLLRVPPKEFHARRSIFHQQREAEFFARNQISDTEQHVVRRGQTAWAIARPRNIPMWLFFRENPHLQQSQQIYPGMKVSLPVIRQVASVQTQTP